MMKPLTIDLEYLCGKMTDMSSLPIRIYEISELKSRFSVVPFVADPADSCLKELLSRRENVSYYLNERSEYYGVVVHEDTTIIIGPVFDSPPTSRQIHNLAFELGVSNRDYEAFAGFISAIAPMPLESVIQMMCSINHILSGEKLNISDFHLLSSSASHFDYESITSSADAFKSYGIERQILDIIRSGDASVLEKWARQAPSIRSGRLSDNLLRQRKNTFIVSTTLAARAAIESGMKVDEAFRMSDSFIQRCENCGHADELNNIQYEMIMAYTQEVGRLKGNTNGSAISAQVYWYVLEHLSEPIRTQDIADSLYLSRSHLSTLFKKETGIELGDYIHQVKMEKARELLKDNTKSIALISDYLGYSSSSHFNRIFRQYTGITPGRYRRTG